MFNNLRIGFRLAAAFIAIVAMMIAVAAFSYVNLSRYTEAVDWNNHTYKVLEQSTDMLMALVNIETGQRGFMLGGTDNLLEPLNSGKAVFEQAFNQIKSLTSDNQSQQQRLEQLKVSYSSWMNDAVMHGTNLRREVGTGQVSMDAVIAEIQSGNGKNQMDAMRKRLADINGVERILLVERSKTMDAIKNVTQLSLVLGCLFSALLSIVFAIWITRSITRPLSRAVTAAENLAVGDLSGTFVIESKDEVGVLLSSMQTMQQNLRDVIGHIASSSNQLASAAEELNVVTEESARALMLQNDEVQQAATAITEMSSAVDEVAGTALKTSEASSQSASLARDGTQKVVQTSSVIEKMNADVRHSTQVINTLAEKVSSINQVLEVIRSVADQTNLLALNAAIEAARAGEAGRGFSVVADEVRSLAYRTQTSTGEIEQMIQQVQSSAKQAVDAMQLISSNADNAQSVAKLAADALELIVENISAISDQNHVIAGAAEEQSKVAREIDRNIVTISDLASQTAEGSSQTNASANELTRLAVQLNELVNKFKV